MSALEVRVLYTDRQNHGEFTGIKRLVRELRDPAMNIEGRPVLDARATQPRPWPWHLPRLRFAAERVLHIRRGPWYGVADLAAERALLRDWVAGRIDVVHYLDGEHSARLLPRTRRKRGLRGRSVATFHQPASVLAEVIPRRLLRDLDHVTVMSATQLSFFANEMSDVPVTVLHHGVDTQFFSPREQSREPGPLRCVTTGSYLRDWRLLDQIANLLSRRTDVHFHVVTAERIPIADQPNISFHRNVTDAALRDLYQTADVLLLPLRDATANNSLLEGMACGLPVIASDLPALREYAPAAGAMFVAGDASAFVSAITELMDDSVTRARMGQAGRARAESLSWTVVARRYERLYAQLAMERLSDSSGVRA